MYDPYCFCCRLKAIWLIPCKRDIPLENLVTLVNLRLAIMITVCLIYVHGSLILHINANTYNFKGNLKPLYYFICYFRGKESLSLWPSGCKRLKSDVLYGSLVEGCRPKKGGRGWGVRGAEFRFWVPS